MAAADEDTDPPPGVERWLVSCDESGIDGKRYYGFGTLWYNWQRRGDFARELDELLKLYSHLGEMKWNKVSKRNIRFYEDLVDWFFRTPWLSFHCLIVDSDIVDRAAHENSMDLARRKHFTMLLVNKIRRCVARRPTRQQTFRIWVDPIPSSYRKADEVVEIIANNVLAKVFGTARPVDKVITRDSKLTPSIQLCDVLLGAVTDEWNQKSSREEKHKLQSWIAGYLGWNDLRSDTHVTERKFNIWFMHDPTKGPRAIVTRPVQLKYAV